jgi:cytochrome P450
MRRRAHPLEAAHRAARDESLETGETDVLERLAFENAGDVFCITILGLPSQGFENRGRFDRKGSGTASPQTAYVGLFPF